MFSVVSGHFQEAVKKGAQGFLSSVITEDMVVKPAGECNTFTDCEIKCSPSIFLYVGILMPRFGSNSS